MRTLRLSLAGTVILALLGGWAVAVLAQSEGDSSTEAVSDAEPAPTVEFSGRFETIGECDWTYGERVRDTMYGHGSSCEFEASMSDARLDGAGILGTTRAIYLRPEMKRFDSNLWVRRIAITIVNDGGAWRELPSLSVNLPTASAPKPYERQIILVGEGDYEGLIAVAYEVPGGVDDPIHGFIIDGLLPHEPESASTR